MKIETAAPFQTNVAVAASNFNLLSLRDLKKVYDLSVTSAGSKLVPKGGGASPTPAAPAPVAPVSSAPPAPAPIAALPGLPGLPDLSNLTADQMKTGILVAVLFMMMG